MYSPSSLDMFCRGAAKVEDNYPTSCVYNVLGKLSKLSCLLISRQSATLSGLRRGESWTKWNSLTTNSNSQPTQMIKMMVPTQSQAETQVKEAREVKEHPNKLLDLLERGKLQENTDKFHPSEVFRV